MTLAQRIASAAAALVVAGGLVLIAVDGTADATGPGTTPDSTAVTTVSVAPGQRLAHPNGPTPTATVGTTGGTTGMTTGGATGSTTGGTTAGTTGAGACAGDAASADEPTRTVVVTPGASIPGVKPTPAPTSTPVRTK